MLKYPNCLKVVYSLKKGHLSFFNIYCLLFSYIKMNKKPTLLLVMSERYKKIQWCKTRSQIIVKE